MSTPRDDNVGPLVAELHVLHELSDIEELEEFVAGLCSRLTELEDEGQASDNEGLQIVVALAEQRISLARGVTALMNQKTDSQEMELLQSKIAKLEAELKEMQENVDEEKGAQQLQLIKMKAEESAEMKQLRAENEILKGRLQSVLSSKSTGEIGTQIEMESLGKPEEKKQSKCEICADREQYTMQLEDMLSQMRQALKERDMDKRSKLREIESQRDALVERLQEQKGVHAWTEAARSEYEKKCCVMSVMIEEQEAQISTLHSRLQEQEEQLSLFSARMQDGEEMKLALKAKENDVSRLRLQRDEMAALSESRREQMMRALEQQEPMLRSIEQQKMQIVNLERARVGLQTRNDELCTVIAALERERADARAARMEERHRNPVRLNPAAQNENTPPDVRIKNVVSRMEWLDSASLNVLEEVETALEKV